MPFGWHERHDIRFILSNLVAPSTAGCRCARCTQFVFGAGCCLSGHSVACCAHRSEWWNVVCRVWEWLKSTLCLRHFLLVSRRATRLQIAIHIHHHHHHHPLDYVNGGKQLRHQKKKNWKSTSETGDTRAHETRDDGQIFSIASTPKSDAVHFSAISFHIVLRVERWMISDAETFRVRLAPINLLQHTQKQQMNSVYGFVFTIHSLNSSILCWCAARCNHGRR